MAVCPEINIQLKEDIIIVLERAKRLAESGGYYFDGDENGGSFGGATLQGKVLGYYTVSSKRTVTIKITQSGAVPCPMIDSKLREFFD